jgi:PEP-CTERM motif
MFTPKICLYLAGGAVIAGSLVSAAIFSPARADVMYTLDTFTGSGSPPAGPYGTVNLHQDGANVDVTVTLSAGEGFVNTGAGAALTWDLAGNPAVTITGLNTTNFAFSHDGTSTGNLDGTGSWFYEIDCTDAGCGHGGSHPNPGPLTFMIDNITTGDFVINNKTTNGYIFASDICTQRGVESGCSGITGDVVASNSPAPAPVPEPATLCLLGTAILGWGALFRRLNNHHQSQTVTSLRYRCPG